MSQKAERAPHPRRRSARSRQPTDSAVTLAYASAVIVAPVLQRFITSGSPAATVGIVMVCHDSGNLSLHLTDQRPAEPERALGHVTITDLDTGCDLPAAGGGGGGQASVERISETRTLSITSAMLRSFAGTAVGSLEIRWSCFGAVIGAGSARDGDAGGPGIGVGVIGAASPD